MKTNGSNANTLRNDNRALLLHRIRRQPVSRAQLAKETGMSKSAVTMITNDLIAEGQLREIGTMESRKGRKPILLDIVPDFRYAVGVSLHRKRIQVLITNLKAELVGCVEEHTERFTSPEVAVGWICRTIRQELERRRIPLSKVVGIGISSPGPLDYREGVILTPPNFTMFHHLPIVSRIRDEFPLPVFLENNAVLLAMAEYSSGAIGDYRNTLFVIMSHGIGSCLIREGQVFRGSGGFAGELGHISVDLGGRPCPCGNRGCLEQYATMAALKERFGFENYADVVDAAYRGEGAAMEILEYQARYLAAGLVSAVNLFDLDAIVLHGEFNYRPERLFSLLSQRIHQQSLITRVHPVAVLPSQLGPYADAVSSTAVVLNRHFSQNLTNAEETT